MIQQNIGVLPWQDEQGVNNYPLLTDVFQVSAVFVDGAFIQFDNFIPVVKDVTFNDAETTITLTTYVGDVTATLAYPHVTNKFVFVDAKDRYHGKLIIGDGFEILRQRNLTRTLDINAQVNPITVQSIPTKAGVFSIDGYYDANVFSGASVQHIHFAPSGNGVTTSAVYVNTCVNDNPLLSINNIAKNSFVISVPDVLTLTPIQGGIRIDLATKGALKIAK
jgi:hypothetical protein